MHMFIKPRTTRKQFVPGYHMGWDVGCSSSRSEANLWGQNPMHSLTAAYRDPQCGNCDMDHSAGLQKLLQQTLCPICQKQPCTYNPGKAHSPHSLPRAHCVNTMRPRFPWRALLEELNGSSSVCAYERARLTNAGLAVRMQGIFLMTSTHGPHVGVIACVLATTVSIVTCHWQHTRTVRRAKKKSVPPWMPF